MSAPTQAEFALWTLFRKLQRHQFPLGVEDYLALRTALRAGFGWASKANLCTLCCALWAKSSAEQAVVRTLFGQLLLEDWKLEVEQSAPESGVGSIVTVQSAPGEGSASVTETPPAGSDKLGSVELTGEEAIKPVVVSLTGVLPPMTWTDTETLPATHVFLSQFPVNYRTVAQTWRRLRWPVREGPRTELDVQETIERRTRTGVATPPVLRSPRRNRAQMLLLVDRQGSMAPFHGFVDEVCDTICRTSRLGNVMVAYFHDVPLEGADPSVLDLLTDPASLSLDLVLPQVQPLSDGVLFDDPELLSPLPAKDILDGYGVGAAIVLISDAGAARGHGDLLRLLDTVAFLKALKGLNSQVVWLNPMPTKYWLKTTAAQIARHVPMFPMDADGMHYAVNILRGHPFALEKAI